MVPVLTHTPPSISRCSMIATDLPSLAAAIAAFCPPGPEPMTTRSYSRMDGCILGLSKHYWNRGCHGSMADRQVKSQTESDPARRGHEGAARPRVRCGGLANFGTVGPDGPKGRSGC